MGMGRDSWHKRRSTGGHRAPLRKKRKFELARPAAMTKIGAKRIHEVRTMGGNKKFRALRLDHGTFSWGSEAISRKVRILGVVYNSSNNELVRTNTLVKNAIVQIDGAPFRQWYEAHYGVSIGNKKGQAVAKDEAAAPQSKSVTDKIAARKADFVKLEHAVDSQFTAGRLYACISSRPGQSGRCDGYILEGKELEFYIKKLNLKKH
ncbi:40S ribosomal protein S8 [Sphaeroforma arctica JP610]|uniref:40S ribosomal protein S8 n=1 Tax=Sphaeroforma arctica JP610 TaxID=667725 RepID=A0A0L0G378_9EUKA|nr:40S ribosomal protein S8 [Sphaeroforma arctica JP610]KNC83324.1 40S ribosomal protein S8 [Sphaeroforma arctica JP610]|eukprot:XP_014157226.1 40S ribosomal protein S8 [Sphaeroforma arctica JP610]